ncbi:MAG: hypothetical protein IJC57_03250 [Clostridia bacterium]|nr:hypothetical protein [Clostridia bacterium]
MKQSKLEKLGIIGLPLKLGSHTYYIGLDPEDGNNKQSKLKVTMAPSHVLWDTVKFAGFLEKDCKFINLEMIEKRLSKLKSSRAGPHKWRQKRAEEATQVKKQKRHRKAPVFTAQSEP